MYTVFRNIRPPPLDQFDLRDMTAREAEIYEGDLAEWRRDSRSREHTVVFIPQSSQIRETMVSSRCKIQAVSLLPQITRFHA